MWKTLTPHTILHRASSLHSLPMLLLSYSMSAWTPVCQVESKIPVKPQPHEKQRSHFGAFSFFLMLHKVEFLLSDSRLRFAGAEATGDICYFIQSSDHQMMHSLNPAYHVGNIEAQPQIRPERREKLYMCTLPSQSCTNSLGLSWPEQFNAGPWQAGLHKSHGKGT